MRNVDFSVEFADFCCRNTCSFFCSFDMLLICVKFVEFFFKLLAVNIFSEFFYKGSFCFFAFLKILIRRLRNKTYFYSIRVKEIFFDKFFSIIRILTKSLFYLFK